MSRHVVVVLALACSVGPAIGQEQPAQFGGAYARLDVRRQHLVDSWVARFVKTTGQHVEPGAFYDEFLSQSTKTTFDAITNALMTTRLTESSGGALGDALGLVAEVDTVRGEVRGASGDRQFRMYVRLVPGAIDTLQRSTEFRRAADNSIYHKGYPTNYRGQGGAPSIQISIALDKRRADIDVDYRSSSFPVGLFNGHLTASNSDIRAGNNFDRHINRWAGLQNWWRGFFGVFQQRPADQVPPSSPLSLPRSPRAGDAKIDAMVNDFLTAWLVEGNVAAAMGYVSERSYACLALDSDDPSTFDPGVAPFQLMMNLKAAYDSLGPHATLDGLVGGMRFVRPGLRVVRQPHHAQFVIYDVRDDVAQSFDCESALISGDPKKAGTTYGKYFGATFYVQGRRDASVALLWGRDQGFWKIVSWKVGTDENAGAPPEPVVERKPTRVAADPAFVAAARAFLDSWLVRHDYDGAFRYISPSAFDCYNLERGDGEPAATSREDAGRRLRASLEASGRSLGTPRSLAAMLSAAEPFHPAIRVMNHRDARTFSLASVPDALADAAECAARINGSTVPDPLPLEYGHAFGMTVRFKTQSGDAPVLRLLWRKVDGAFQITAYGVELP